MRVLARLDVKNQFVIKGIHLEGLRKVGDPNELARRYYEQGADEILFMDAVASLYDRNNLFDVIEQACTEVFVPMTLGGGIRKLGDVEKALAAGADKVAVNTQAVREPSFVTEIARRYGSQCIVGSVEAKRLSSGSWEAYVDNGRERTGLSVSEWSSRLEDLGVGEILVTSIDQEGTRSGFDIELLDAVEGATRCPVVLSGGYGSPSHLTKLRRSRPPSGIAVAAVLHYGVATVAAIKQGAGEAGIEVRR